MYTPPDGSRRPCSCSSGTSAQFRDANGGDDASIVYHEYTHGLSSRLITDAAGAAR